MDRKPTDDEKLGLVGPAFLWNLNSVVADGTVKRSGASSTTRNPLPAYSALAACRSNYRPPGSVAHLRLHQSVSLKLH